MTRAFGLLLGVFAGALPSRTAHADGPRGYANFALGAGLMAGAHSFASATNLGDKYFTREGVAGPFVGLSIGGGRAWPRAAVGGVFDISLMESFWNTEFGGGSAYMASFSATAAIRPEPAEGPYASVAVGVAFGGTLSHSEIEGVPPVWTTSSTAGDTMAGPRLALTLGHSWSNGLGFATTPSVAYLVAQDSNYLAIMIALQATLTSW